MWHRIRRIVLGSLAASLFLVMAPAPSHAGWIFTPGRGWIWAAGPVGPIRPFPGPGFHRGYNWHYHNDWHRNWYRH